MTNDKIEQWLQSPCTGHYCNGTWRDWFRDLFDALFKDGAGCGGKRPGNNDSDWEAILAYSLVDADILKGTKTWRQDWDEMEYDYQWSDYTDVMRSIVGVLLSRPSA